MNTEDSLGLQQVPCETHCQLGGMQAKGWALPKQLRFRALVHTVSFQVPDGSQNSCINLPFFVPRDMEIIFGQFDSLKK